MAFDHETYYELDYIQSSGTQIIDTGVAPNGDNLNKLKIEADMAFVEVPTGATSQYMFGTGYYNSTAGSRRTICVGYRQDTSTTKLAYLNGAQFTTIVEFTNSTLDTNRHIFGIDQINKNYIFDSNTQAFTTTMSTNVSKTLVVFCGRNSSSSGAPTSYYASAKCYRFKVYSNSVLIRDMVPAMRKDDSTAIGLLDIVNGVFYTNAGTGSFTYGSKASTGALYVKVNGEWKKGVSYVKVNGEWK